MFQRGCTPPYLVRRIKQDKVRLHSRICTNDNLSCAYLKAVNFKPALIQVCSYIGLRLVQPLFVHLNRTPASHI